MGRRQELWMQLFRCSLLKWNIRDDNKLYSIKWWPRNCCSIPCKQINLFQTDHSVRGQCRAGQQLVLLLLQKRNQAELKALLIAETANETQNQNCPRWFIQGICAALRSWTRCRSLRKRSPWSGFLIAVQQLFEIFRCFGVDDVWSLLLMRQKIDGEWCYEELHQASEEQTFEL